MKILKLLIITLLFFMVTIHAGAAEVQGASSPPSDIFVSGSYDQNISESLSKLNVGINNFTQHFYLNTSDIGEKLFLYLSLISISWAGIKLAMSSGGSLSEPMNELVKIVFTVGFAFWIMHDGYDLMIVGGIDGLCNKLTELALPAGSTFQDGFINFSSAQFSVLGNIIGKYTERGWYDIITNIGPMLILTIVLQVLFIIFALVALIGFMSALVTVGIALAVGPIFIPFLVLEKTSFLFDGWLKFMITASFTKVIISIIISIGLFAFEAIGTGKDNILGMMIVSTALGGMLAFQLLRAPEIAQAIMSGNAVSFARFAARAGKAVGGGVGSIAGMAKAAPISTPRPRAAPIPTPTPSANSSSQARRPNRSSNTGLAVRGGRQGVTIDQEPQQKPAGEISSNSSPQLPSSKS